MITYKTYTARVEYDAEAKIFHGEVIALKDIITFQAVSVEEIEQSFKDSVEDYLAFCKERGEKPEKPFSGILYTQESSKIGSLSSDRSKFISYSTSKTFA